MKEQLIKKYITRLTINDTRNFANKNNISLNDDELQIVYNQIKENWQTLIYGDANIIFNDLKGKLNNTAYLKIKDLYTTSKEKYQLFL